MEYAGLVQGEIEIVYFYFVGSSTVTLYLLHRYIGLAKVTAAQSIDARYRAIRIIAPYYPYLGFVFGSLSVYYLIQVGIDILPVILIPMVISGLYVIPLLPGGRRLRDISYVKIFLIALTWTWFSVWYLVGKIDTTLLSIITIEHLIFMIGITLPFDIRDMQIDTRDGVSTLATYLGVSKSISLTRLLLIVSYGLTLIILYLIGSSIWAYISYSFLLCGLLLMMRINYSKSRDVYITGVLDGLILLKGLIGWVYIVG